MQFKSSDNKHPNDPPNTLSREGIIFSSIRVRVKRMYMYNIHTVELKNTLMTPITRVCVIVLGKNWGSFEIHTYPLMDPTIREVLL